MTEKRSRRGPRAPRCFRPPSLVLLGFLAACETRPETPADVPPAADADAEPVAVVPAEYATDVAFVGFAAEPVRLYARFVNETSESTLKRHYAGWLETGGTWRALAELNDVLPVPRAAWRVLPGGAWRVLADDGGELAGLVYRDTLIQLRLTPEQLVAEWTGETGQREALLQARAQHGDSLQHGLLVLRRSARVQQDRDVEEGASAPADTLPAAPSVGIRTQLFLLVDSLSNGLLVARDASDPDSTAVAWTWVGSIGNEWTDVRIRPPPENASRALDRWLVELPEAGVTARFRVERLPDGSTSDEVGRAPRPFGISGRLEILGSGLPASGIGLESRS